MTINEIHTGKNYAFIEECFIHARHDSREQRTLAKILGESHQQVQEANSKRLKGVGLEGASRTGKTVDACIFICMYADKYSGKQITIFRDTLANLKETTYKTFQEVWSWFNYPMHFFNKAATGFTYKDNNFTFLGVNDNIMKAHGHESDLMFGNEVIGIPKATVDQLEQRNKDFFIYDYNPSEPQHWAYEMQARPDVRTIKTTVFDNKFIPPNALSKILSYAHPEAKDEHVAKKIGKTKTEWQAFKEKNLQLNTANLTSWLVYGLGQRAKSEHTIFTNWDTYCDLPEGYDFKLYGLDFGYMSDPTALVQVVKNGHDVYVKELLYSTGYLNNDIAQHIIDSGHKNELIICDTSPAQNRDELIKLDVNAEWCNKFPGSKTWSIQHAQQHRIFIHEDSVNLKREIQNYRWATDRAGNIKRNSLKQRVPLDKDDHTLDAFFYALCYYLAPPDLRNNEETS